MVAKVIIRSKVEFMLNVLDLMGVGKINLLKV